jgi:hypothetical protein
MSQETLILIYYAYLHSLITYTIIFMGNSPYNTDIFRLQKKIRTITNSKNRDSYRNLFKNLNILTFISVVITDREQYITNSDIRGRHSRYGSDIHQTISNLSLYHRGSYHMGLKDINSLPWKELIKHVVVVQRLKWRKKESCNGSEV